MMITAELKVYNEVELGRDKVKVESNCYHDITFYIPTKSGEVTKLELSKEDLFEFITRSSPTFNKRNLTINLLKPHEPKQP